MKNKSIAFTILFTAIVYISGCHADNPEINISAKDYLMLDESSESIILDVRTDSEYKAGHVKNAILINLRAPDFMDKIRDLNKDQTYYVYCKSGVRSRSAVIKMRKEGISKAYNISGGIIDLTRNGLSLEK
jgi:rhodanese-related sulfurtransferase